MQNMHDIINYLQLSTEQFSQRKALIDLSLVEVALLEKIHLPLQQYESQLINGFYQHLLQFEPLRIILADPEVLARLKQKQTLYFRDLTAGVYDICYAENRLRVGVAHERVGLNSQWYIGAYGAYLTLSTNAIVEILQDTPQNIAPTLTALHKVALLDITLAFDAYMYASHKTLRKTKQDVSAKFSYQLRQQAAINRIQTAFISDSSDDSALDILLQEMLALTESQLGLVADVKHNKQGQPYLKLKAISDSRQAPQKQNTNLALGMELHQLNNLLGAVILTKQAVISNDIENDPRSGKLDQGDVKVKSYLGFPIYCEGKISSMLALINREQGYDEAIIETLQPVIEALGVLTVARKIKETLERTLIDNARLAIVAKQTINGVVITDTSFNIQWCNSGYFTLTGYSLLDVVGQRPFSLQRGENTSELKLAELEWAVKNLQPIDLDIIKYKKNRSQYWARVSCNPIYDNDGLHSGFVLVELDTTDAHQQKDALLHYKSVLDQMVDGVLFIDAHSLQISYANLGLQQQLGMTEQQVLALKPYDIKLDFDESCFKELIQPLISGAVDNLYLSTWHITASGNKMPVEVSMQLIRTAFDKDIIINLVRDMSAQQQVEQLRCATEKQVNNLLLRSEDAIAIINKKQRIIQCNQAALSLFGFTNRSQMLGLTPREIGMEQQLTSIEIERSKLIDKAWQEGYQRFNWSHKTPRSEQTPMEITLTPVIYNSAPCLQLVWRDLTEIKAKERKVKQLAYFDELTGLANKNLFAARLKYLLTAAKSNNYTVAVIYFDIIKLAEVNETMGYKGGDITIKAVAERFAGEIRNADITSKFIDDDINQHADININDIDRGFDYLARIHADKFALAAVLTSPTTACNLINRIQQVIRPALSILGNDLSVSVRAGLALYPSDSMDYEMLIRAANMALGYAKEQQLPYCFYNSDLGEKVQRRALIIKRLEHTLTTDNSNLSLRYQPQIDLNTGRLCGAEVLIRWFDHELGWVSPDVFIPLAEERGLINAITSWVIDTACKQLISWQQAGYYLQEKMNLKLAVNISAKSLDMPDIVNHFVEQITLLGLSAVDFEIELTETGIMRDPTQAIGVLHQLKQQGFKLAIDDFGTGHSSLSYLKNINADVLKIDMCFVQTLLTDKTNHAIVKTVIATAKIFGMQTLAEGVEEQAIADELINLGCDYAQGYFYAKPLLAEEFEQLWLRTYISH